MYDIVWAVVLVTVLIYVLHYFSGMAKHDRPQYYRIKGDEIRTTDRDGRAVVLTQRDCVVRHPDGTYMVLAIDGPAIYGLKLTPRQVAGMDC